eukprot:gene5430-10885_t
MTENDSEESMTFPEFMGGIEETLTRLVKESSKMPTDMSEHWQAFSAAIDWKEPWIRGLLMFHIICISVTLLFRKHYEVQAILFLFLTALVFLSESINSYCSEHWRLFSNQNYFDQHGVFSGIMFSGPLLLICFFQLINALVLAGDALIIAKRHQLKQRLKQEKKSD